MAPDLRPEDVARWEVVSHAGQRGGAPVRVIAIHLVGRRKQGGKPDLFACPLAGPPGFICTCSSFQSARADPFPPQAAVGNVRKHWASKHDLAPVGPAGRADPPVADMRDFIAFDAEAALLGIMPEDYNLGLAPRRRDTEWLEEVVQDDRRPGRRRAGLHLDAPPLECEPDRFDQICEKLGYAPLDADDEAWVH
ncbi:MAG: hypothetical protein AAFS07_19295, partial [Pseudomonadota bacterium]